MDSVNLSSLQWALSAQGVKIESHEQQLQEVAILCGHRKSFSSATSCLKFYHHLWTPPLPPCHPHLQQSHILVSHSFQSLLITLVRWVSVSFIFKQVLTYSTDISRVSFVLGLLISKADQWGSAVWHNSPWWCHAYSCPLSGAALGPLLQTHLPSRSKLDPCIFKGAVLSLKTPASLLLPVQFVPRTRPLINLRAVSFNDYQSQTPMVPHRIRFYLIPLSSGNKLILTIVGRFSKGIYYVPWPKLHSALKTAQLLTTHVFCLHGIPVDIVSDCGPQFASQAWKAFCQAICASINLSSGYRPQSTGNWTGLTRTWRWH